MPRPVKYPDGHVFENGFTLLHRTSGGKALFRYASGGTEKEHYIADVAAKKISGERPYQYSDDYQPGDEVGHAGIVLVKFLGNGRGLFRHPDGHECEHQFRHVVTDRIRGYREPARTYTYKVGEQFGPNGFILLSEPKHGEAMFRRPDGSRRTYRIADVASEAVTGKPRGRPKGKRNNYRSLAEKYDFKSRTVQ
jgi:hypothetical protein